jgi:High potential iron-sulfur protein
MRELNRRSFFRLGLVVSAGVAAGTQLVACSGGKTDSAAASACAGPDQLSPSDMSLRESNHYVEASADPAKACTACSFFTPATDGGSCGTCQIFTGGPANAQGSCDSWSAKA